VDGNGAAPMVEPDVAGTWRDALVDDGKNTIASQLVDRLREAIVSGELQPGAKINLDRARESFAVSLSPLREALARLIPDGLVIFEDNRGYRVAPVSQADLREITRLRSEFESLALRQAIAVAPPSWEGEVMRALHRLNTAERDPDEPGTLERWEALHREFHLALLAGCEMPRLLRFCQTLLNLNDRYRRKFLVRTSGDRNVGAEHGEIAQGAVARDADYACGRLLDHIHRTGSNLAAHLSGRIAP